MVYQAGLLAALDEPPRKFYIRNYRVSLFDERAGPGLVGDPGLGHVATRRASWHSRGRYHTRRGVGRRDLRGSAFAHGCLVRMAPCTAPTDCALKSVTVRARCFLCFVSHLFLLVCGERARGNCAASNGR